MKELSIEEKDLLLRDLCARLPYGVICKSNSYRNILFNSSHISLIESEEIKPYLRPISSMTEKERHKLLKFGAIIRLENGEVIDVSCVGFERHADVQDYLNTCHFDYRGLIEKGLALIALEGMYNLENE